MKKPLITIIMTCTLAIVPHVASAECGSWGKVTYINANAYIGSGSQDGYAIINNSTCIFFSDTNISPIVTVLAQAMASGRDVKLTPADGGYSVEMR